jgi:hypothetical protein
MPDQAISRDRVVNAWTSRGGGGSEYWLQPATMAAAVQAKTQRCIVPILCSGLRGASGRPS